MEEKTYNLAKICEPVAAQLDDFCKLHGIVGLVQAGHACITCSSSQVYNARRNYYDMDSRFIYQAVVSGRRIALVGLKEDITTSAGNMGVLEIIDQKEDKSQTDRLTHIAVVPTGISYEELLERLKGNGANLEDKSRRDGYTATDVILPTTFRIRIEKEPLLDRIKREELN